MTVVRATSEQPAEQRTGGDVGLAFGERWECAALPPGAATDPAGLAKLAADWLAAEVPGTAAGALRAAGRPAQHRELDEQDWWFRCRFDGRVDGRRRCRGAAPARARRPGDGGRRLVERRAGAAQREHVPGAARRSRRRRGRERARRPVRRAHPTADRAPGATRAGRRTWSSTRTSAGSGTSLLGRIPGWAVVPPIVGPWRPVRLLGPGDVVPTTVALRATCDGDGGVVTVSFDLVANAALADATPTDGKLRITRLGVPAAVSRGVGGDGRRPGDGGARHGEPHGGRARRTVSPGGDGAVGRGRALVAAHARFAAAVRGLGRRRRPVAPARGGRVPDDRGRSRRRRLPGGGQRRRGVLPRARAGCRSTRSRSRRRRRSSSTGWRSPGRPT